MFKYISLNKSLCIAAYCVSYLWLLWFNKKKGYAKTHLTKDTRVQSFEPARLLRHSFFHWKYLKEFRVWWKAFLWNGCFNEFNYFFLHNGIFITGFLWVSVKRENHEENRLDNNLDNVFLGIGYSLQGSNELVCFRNFCWLRIVAVSIYSPFNIKRQVDGIVVFPLWLCICLVNKIGPKPLYVISGSKICTIGRMPSPP